MPVPWCRATATGWAESRDRRDRARAAAVGVGTDQQHSPELLLRLRHEPGSGSLNGVAQAYKSGDAEGLLGNFLMHSCQLHPR